MRKLMMGVALVVVMVPLVGAAALAAEPPACPTSAPAGYLTVSGSPTDEVATGQNVYFPAGFYNSGTSTMNLAPGQKVTGAGRDAVTLTSEGFDVNSNTTVECIRMVGSRQVSFNDAFTTTHVSGAQTGVVLQDLKIEGYQVALRTQDFTQVQFLHTNTTNVNYGVYRAIGAGSRIAGNNFALGPDLGYSNYKAGIELAGVSDVVVENNTITGGIAGIKALSGYSVAPRASVNVQIRNNTITGFTEEGISADLRGNSATDNGVREMDRISSVSGITVVLQGSYSSSPYGNGYHYLSVYSGACRGHTYRITAQSLRTFTLAQTPTCVPAAGDRVSIGIPHINWKMENNYVDASQGLTALQYWGLSFNSTITNNQVVEPPEGPPVTGYPPAAISLMSLQGLSGTGQVTTGGSRSANVDGITVSGNQIVSTNPGPRALINVGNSAWGDCSNFYTPRLNSYTLNEMPVVREDSCF
jgi:hypothetical protein